MTSKYLSALIIAASGLALGMLAVTPNVGHSSEAYNAGYQDGVRAGQRSARRDAPQETYPQQGGMACCGGGQQQPPAR